MSSNLAGGHPRTDSKLNLNNEIYRKSLHLLLLIIPIAFCYFGKFKSVAILSVITAVVVSLDFFRHKNLAFKEIFRKIFGKILRSHELENNKLCGASWVFIGACINFLFFEKSIAVVGFSILVISDALAALVGKSFPSKPFFEKSLFGSLAFFISATLVLICCGLIFDAKFLFYLFGIFTVSCVTVIEARPSLFDVDDNFLLPVSFGLIMTTFDFMWQYT